MIKMYRTSLVRTLGGKISGSVRLSNRKSCNIDYRCLYSLNKKWDPEFNFDVRIDIENHWRDKLTKYDEENKYTEAKVDMKKHYVLSMFPYPSGALHMGHVRVYTISDAMARFFRLKGYNVLHPMGWDAFGLPAENAAIDRGEQPEKWTRKNIDNMRKQLKALCLSFDWDREYMTCDPSYYKWTQDIFLKMYKADLVYQKEAPVNWDPVDQTVLADEQIDEEGRSWRSGAVAEKRLLRQWYIRTSAYSKSLYDGLEEVNRDLWKDVIDIQKDWIGRYDGIKLELQINPGDCPAGFNTKISVFTRTPEAIYGASHILLSPDHHILSQLGKTNTKDKLDIHAVHPFTGKLIPIFSSSTFNFGQYLDSHLGIPSMSEADAEFAKTFNLTVTDVIDFDGQGRQILKNSQKFSGLERHEAFKMISEHAKELKCGGQLTSERGRDWLISRQRYWGTPIPVIHCSSCGAVPVPEKDLPVILPKLDKLTGKGLSPLKEAHSWKNVNCPECGREAERETDTMDTFVDSSWYFLRYCDPHNCQQPFSPDTAHSLMPVDLYIGGKEHAILHLYYARFFNHFLHNLGQVPTREPFVNLLTQGMVMGQSYRTKESGRYLPKDNVDFSGDVPVEKGTGEALTVEWAKMSKSKFNGVDPQAVLDEYGTDSTRLCILSNVAPKTDRNWDPKDMVGILRWQARIWNLVTALHKAHHQDAESNESPNTELRKEWEEKLYEARNIAIKEVTWDLGHSFLLNVAISRLQAFTKTLARMPPHLIFGSEQFERALCELVIMLAPFAPMYTSEMWTGLQAVCKGHHFNMDRGVLGQNWPVNDEDYTLKLKVRRGRDDCFEIRLPVKLGREAELTRQDFVQLAMSHHDYQHHLGDLDKNRFKLEVEPGVKAAMNYTLTKEQEKEMKARKKQESIKKAASRR